MITKLEIENFKRLTAVAIEPDGSPLVIVGGENGAGKSSTLDAIEAALGGGKRAPEDPIRHGAKRSRIVVETKDLIVTRVFSAKGSRLEVRPHGEGAIKLSSPQTVLDALVGSLTFDPLAFGRESPERQTKILRELAGIDLEQIERQCQQYETERRDAGRDLKKAAAALEAMGPEPEGAAPALTAAEILAEIEAREQRNDDRNSKRAKLEAMRRHATNLIADIGIIKGELEDHRLKISELEAVAAELSRDLETTREGGKELAAEVETLEPNEPTGDLKAQLKDAEGASARAAESKRRAELVKEAKDLRAEHDRLNRLLDEARQVKADSIAKAKYPIEGLEARDDGVYLRGVPWRQASSAEALKASVAIGLALNPRLKVLLIREGSLLDAKSMAMVRDMATEAGAQLWIERVSTGKGCTVVIEDGTVAK